MPNGPLLDVATQVLLVGVKAYQTVPGREYQQYPKGSPGSVVAVEKSAVSLNGRAETTVADAKLSFVAAKVLAGTNRIRSVNANANNSETFVFNPDLLL